MIKSLNYFVPLLQSSQVLQAKFNDFAQELFSNEDVISSLVTRGHDLLPDHGKNEETINARCEEIQFLWQQLKEMTNHRTEVCL